MKDAAKKLGSEGHSTATAPLVLVVDDFQDNREMYAEYLEFTGYRVHVAKNGQEALERAFADCPDLIVMDLSLPVLDGWEATRRLKADPRTKSVPVIALTGHALAGHSQGAKDAGCDGFLAKPCLPQTLADKVRQILDASKSKANRSR
jgi:CheY-like chemotaxis protein